MVLEIRTVVAGGDEDWLDENTREISGVLEMFSFLIRMFAACVYIFAKIHRTVHLKICGFQCMYISSQRNVKKKRSEVKV